MQSWKWGGALVGAATLAVLVGLQSWGGWPRPIVDGAPRKENGLTLVGFFEASGIELSRCEVRCTSMRLEDTPTLHRAALERDGRFVLTGLDDVDYCLEVVLRDNPALVVARREYVRPDGEEVVLECDPAELFGPTGHLNATE